MSRFWLIRHGQTDWNLEGRWQGQAPHAPTLNATGRAQAVTVAKKLAGHAFTALYSSDLARAVETAETISAWIGVPMAVEPRLREVNLGVWEGMRSDELAIIFSSELRVREIDPVNARPPGGGETAAEVATRIRAAADDFAARHPNEDIVLVSHGLALAALICQAQGWPLSEIFERIPENARALAIHWPPVRS